MSTKQCSFAFAILVIQWDAVHTRIPSSFLIRLRDGELQGVCGKSSPSRPRPFIFKSTAGELMFVAKVHEGRLLFTNQGKYADHQMPRTLGMFDSVLHHSSLGRNLLMLRPEALFCELSCCLTKEGISGRVSPFDSIQRILNGIQW
jgi:hypothetical protein